MFRRKQARKTKFVVECLTSSYWAFKLSERDFKDFSNFISHVIDISQSSNKSLVLLDFDDISA